MGALEQFTKQAIAAALPKALLRDLVREVLTESETMILLKDVSARVGEKSAKRTLTALAAMKVPVRELSARRHYVLRSELEAAMRGLPVKAPKRGDISKQPEA